MTRVSRTHFKQTKALKDNSHSCRSLSILFDHRRVVSTAFFFLLLSPAEVMMMRSVFSEDKNTPRLEWASVPPRALSRAQRVLLKGINWILRSLRDELPTLCSNEKLPMGGRRSKSKTDEMLLFAQRKGLLRQQRQCQVIAGFG